MTTREELHKLVDHIPETDVDAARKILRSLVNPVELALLAAPLDDEDEPDAEREAVEKALSNPASDIPMEDVVREFGQ